MVFAHKRNPNTNNDKYNDTIFNVHSEKSK